MLCIRLGMRAFPLHAARIRISAAPSFAALIRPAPPATCSRKREKGFPLTPRLQSLRDAGRKIGQHAIGEYWSNANETTDHLAGKLAEILKSAKQ